MTIKAIETEYNGYKFRSRLEARWAVFFDAMGIEYEYEPEGYEGFCGKKYLPDFRLPGENNLLVEVKGSDDQLEKDWDKISAAIDFDSTPAGNGLLILGQIPNPEKIGWGSIPVFTYLECRKGVSCKYAAFKMKYNKYHDSNIAIGSDAIMRAVYYFPYKDDYSAYGCDMPECVSTKERFISENTVLSSNFASLKEAYKAARQARFEHGETPVIRHE